MLADDPAFVNLLPQSARVKAIAEQLLGAAEVQEIRSTGGVYGTLPMWDKAKAKNACHLDSNLDSRQRLSCVAYIDDVAPHGGSFMVWPGSHRKCHAFLTTTESAKRNGYAGPAGKKKKNLSGGPDRHPTWAAGMAERQRWCEDNIVPVDTWGEAGTVIFYHSRLAHMAGNNYSDNVRQAVLIRFAKTEASLPDGALLEHARSNDIWREWSRVVRETATAGGESADDAWTELDGLRFTETGYFPLGRIENDARPRL